VFDVDHRARAQHIEAERKSEIRELLSDVIEERKRAIRGLTAVSIKGNHHVHSDDAAGVCRLIELVCVTADVSAVNALASRSGGVQHFPLNRSDDRRNCELFLAQRCCYSFALSLGAAVSAANSRSRSLAAATNTANCRCRRARRCANCAA
jgi:hypothetical protein